MFPDPSTPNGLQQERRSQSPFPQLVLAAKQIATDQAERLESIATERVANT